MKRTLVRKDSYHDSVFLMSLGRGLEALPGVSAAVVCMGTPLNLEPLAVQGYGGPELSAAGPNDLVVAVDCANEAAASAAVLAAEALVAGGGGSKSGGEEVRPACLDSALAALPDATLALVSVPGAYAAREARKALERGLDVMLFSDNVSLEDEIALKELSASRGLLVMGPDCGTAIVGGKPLCFANAVRLGPIGIVAASGTGLQEVSCLVDRFGSGVSHALGTGGRDLKDPRVGGASTLMAIRALALDPGTSVIALVSKPPAPEVAARVVAALGEAGKPAVVHFVGPAEARPCDAEGMVHFADSLEETAAFAVALSRGLPCDPDIVCPAEPRLEALVEREARRIAPAQKYLRGLFAGGTLADEALYAVRSCLGEVNSNLGPAPALEDPRRSKGHAIVDLGDDAFTVGRPHPMIDPEARAARIVREGEDPGVAVLLLDLVLGYGSHPDPAGAILPAIAQARAAAEARGGYLPVVASVIGVPGDPQGFADQREKLEHSGCVVMSSNARASMLAARIIEFAAGRAPCCAPRGTADGPDGAARCRDAATAPTTLAAASASGAAAAPTKLLASELKVVSLGLDSFADNLIRSGVETVKIDWKPPAGGDARAIAALDRLSRRTRRDAIDAANREAVSRMLAGRPVVVGIGRALDTVPGMTRDTVLHAGPPVAWERMCGPMRGGVIGGLIYEGLASTREEAESLAASGSIRFEPCHHHDSVGPMAGIVTASMPVWILENEERGNRAYCTLNEGLGKVLRYGAYSPEVIERLRWMERELAPLLAAALALRGKLDMRLILAQALQMGDEGHNRNRAGTSLVIRELAPSLVRLGADRESVAKALEFINGNDHFFLNLSMPASKCVADAARGIEGSSVIVTMARNGTDFGIRVSGLGDRWFTGPASVVEGLYLPGFGPADAALDIGDSVITETAGIGGFAMAAAPAIVRFVGGSPSDALDVTRRMYEITLAESEAYKIPALDFRGTPTAIDLRKVVETGILPAINTGIAHREPGVGMVGAGLVKPPRSCFHDALAAFAERYGDAEEPKGAHE